MATEIKIDLPALLKSGKPIVVDLGCGRMKKPGRIGVDALELEGVDIVANIDEGLSFFPDGSVDEIHSVHFLEHVRDIESVLCEMGRILKPGGRIYAYVPHFSNPHFYSDYTHKTFFGMYTLDYFTEESTGYSRRVGCYSSRVRVKVLSRRHIFGSRVKPIHFLKKAFQAIVNARPGCQEFYEESLCWVFPCLGLELVFSAQSLEVAPSASVTAQVSADAATTVHSTAPLEGAV